MPADSPDRVIIFDTTLRDGEQSPGCSLNSREKLEIGRQLAAMKVDVIEAGFPITSPGDFEAVQAIAEEVKGPVIAGLARCVDKDIDAAARALKPAPKSRIHVFLATSEIHRKYKLKKAKDEILRLAVEGVKLAKSFCPDIEFSPEDASRTEPDFLVEVVTAVIEAGATTVNIPDTVGYAVPTKYRTVIRTLFERVPNIGQAIISVHCHNDLGLAVANSLVAVEAGARQVECTINGLGERAGNAAMEEIVMALKTRSDHFGVTCGVVTQQLCAASRLVSSLTGMVVQRNKAIVGANAFAHEAGIHQHGVLSAAETYEIMRPQDVGLQQSTLVLGKHSGRHALKERIEQLGHSLSDQQLDLLFERFKQLADKKKEIYDEDLVALIDEELADVPDVFQIVSFHTTSGTGIIPTATVAMRLGDGTVVRDAATGDGPVDAICNTIDRITGIECRLFDYHIRAVTQGKDALGEVTLTVQSGVGEARGRAVSTDIIQASAQAYLNAVNRLVARAKGAGPASQAASL